MVAAASMLPRVRLISTAPHHQTTGRSSCVYRRCDAGRAASSASSMTPLPRRPLLFFLTPRVFSSSVIAKQELSFTRLMLQAESTMSCAEVSKRRKRVSFQPGLLVEFNNNSGETRLGMMTGREGKKNWNILDQNGELCTVRVKQINVAVPGAHNFTPNEISDLLRQSELLQDPSRLEVAWEALTVSNRKVDLEDLAMVLYGSMAPDKCYSAYRLLAANPIFFECIDDSICPLYEPRTLEEVRQLRLRLVGEHVKAQQQMDFVALIKSVMELPYKDKPKCSFWDSKVEYKTHIASLRAVALEDIRVSSEGKKAGLQVLEALGTSKNSAGAINLLIHMGYSGVHENFELLKLGLPIPFCDEALQAVRAINDNNPADIDEDKRVDLTSLKVYTIDMDSPKEIDDGLSAMKLPDGRIKVWVHVADPTRWVIVNSALKREASKRCLSIYLPTMTIPMFPMDLAWDVMSLRQGQCRPAVSVSAILSHDGSIAEAHVENSLIRLAYNVSYEAATELLSLNVEEEAELYLLYQAALLRNKWRRCKGATRLYIPKPRVCVKGHDTPDPDILISINDDTCPSAVLVTEMMVLCGEVIAKFGGERGLSLPYRCQTPNEQMFKDLHWIPEGPARMMALLRSSPRADVNLSKPLQHASLGLSGYVQFTSPIRRYADLLAHFQIKAVLRGENPPLTTGDLEAAMVAVNDASKTARRLQSDSERYWILVYLRRQSPERKYHASVIRHINDSLVVVFLTEMAFQNFLEVRWKRRLGDEIFVQVVDVQPRKNHLQLREC